MNERVREIVDLLVEMISGDGDPPDTEIALIERLVKRGYHLGEIDAALETVLSLPVRVTILESRESGRMRTHQSSRRVLVPAEQLALSKDAQGLLLRMVDCGLVTDVELEEVLFEVVSQGQSNMGVPELLLVLMRIIRDEDRLAMVTSSPVGVKATQVSRGDLN